MYHSKGIALGRVAALFFSLDCKPSCMESRKTKKYRYEHHAPLPGADGDLARLGDEQLLDAFLLIKRILDDEPRFCAHGKAAERLRRMHTNQSSRRTASWETVLLHRALTIYIYMMTVFLRHK